MRVLLAGGGTAGHINPALAIAGFIKSKNPDAEFLFIGNKGGMEETLVQQAGYKMEFIVISGFSRKFTPKGFMDNVKTVKRTLVSSVDAKKIIKKFNPDICIGTGGYVSGPVVRAAVKLGVPSVIHEQNAFPGVTNKMLAKNVNKVMLAVPDAKKHFDSKAEFAVTGNPVRGKILSADKKSAREKLGLDNRPVVLSFGGSLGARKINEAIAPLIARSGKDGKYQHIHAYGKYGKWFPELVMQNGTDISQCSNLDVREYINDMDICMAAADLVICRAGAITLSEIQAMGKPAILIPSPNVAENHQYHNAMALVNAGAADIIEETDLSADIVKNKIDRLLLNSGKLEEYAKNAKKSAIIDANERIYSVIKSVLGMV